MKYLKSISSSLLKKKRIPKTSAQHQYNLHYLIGRNLKLEATNYFEKNQKEIGITKTEFQQILNTKIFEIKKTKTPKTKSQPEKKIKHKKEIVCPACDGIGENIGNKKKCATCNGTGLLEIEIDCDICGGKGYIEGKTTYCKRCKGTGYYLNNPNMKCYKCNGTGEESFEVTVPCPKCSAN